MSLVGFRASNHPQQVTRSGADDEVDDRGTPQDFWDELNERYRFTLDVAAAPHNAKTANYYTRLADGLLQPWTGSVWCNPPYSGLDRWLEKAWTEFWKPDGPDSIVMLLPANRPEQPWWQRWVEPYRDRPLGPLQVRFLPGRLRFIKPGATEVKPNERPPFGCVLLIWTRNPKWAGPMCHMCLGTGITPMRPGHGVVAYLHCPSCNGHVQSGAERGRLLA